MGRVIVETPSGQYVAMDEFGEVLGDATPQEIASLKGSTTPPAESGKSPKSWRMCEIEQDCSYGWDLQAAQKFID